MMKYLAIMMLLAGCGGKMDASGAYVAMSFADVMHDDLILGSGPAINSGSH